MRVIVNTKTGIEDAGEVVRWCDEWAIVALDDGRVGPIYYRESISRFQDAVYRTAHNNCVNTRRNTEQ